MSCLSQAQMQRMLDAVTGYCGPAPDPVKIHTIGHQVERFCKDTGGIVTHLGPVPMNRESGIYFAVAPYAGVVFDVKNVIVGAEVAHESTYRLFFYDDGRASLTFPFGRREGVSLELDVLWRPGERTTQMPPQWFDKHFDALMHGSISAILSQIGTAWGNPPLAKQFEEEYSRDVNDVIRDIRAAQSPNGQLSAFDPTARWI